MRKIMREIFKSYRMLVVMFSFMYLKLSKDRFLEIVKQARADGVELSYIRYYLFESRVKEVKFREKITIVDEIYQASEAFFFQMDSYSRLVDFLFYNDFFQYRIRDTYYNFKHGIKNFYEWRKIIWRDRDWDQDYFYTIIKFKLERMSVLHGDYGDTENSVNVREQTKQCVSLIDKILKDNYEEKTLAEIEKKYGKTIFHFEDLDHGLGSRLHFIKEDGTERTSQELAETNNAYRVAHEQKVADIKMLFDIIKNNIERWWD